LPSKASKRVVDTNDDRCLLFALLEQPLPVRKEVLMSGRMKALLAALAALGFAALNGSYPWGP
jgi:hypothetical protein